MTTWEQEHALRIGKEIQRLRGKRSAQWLAERCSELGFKFNRATIADLENGRRRAVSTAELVVLAYALDTSPIALVFPGDPRSEIDVLPNRRVTNIDAAEWFSGLMGLPVESGITHAEWDEQQRSRRQNQWLLNAARRRREYERASKVNATYATQPDLDDDMRQALLKESARYQQEIERLDREITDAVAAHEKSDPDGG